MDGFLVHVNQNERNQVVGDDANRFATSQRLSDHAAVRPMPHMGLALVIRGRLHH
jgi:hypothetical protein